MKEFAMEHPIITLIIIWMIFGGLFKIVNRFFRHLNIRSRGYPTAPNMDADGDIVHPPEKEEAE
jgi:hypothetical protein